MKEILVVRNKLLFYYYLIKTKFGQFYCNDTNIQGIAVGKLKHNFQE